MTITRETLELAAKAAGIDTSRVRVVQNINRPDGPIEKWEPDEDHGQLHDLAMACDIMLDPLDGRIRYWVGEEHWRRMVTVNCKDFTALAEAVITAAAEQQLAKEKKE